MFGPIGMPELILIFLVALLVFGPKKLPELGKGLGQSIRGFKEALKGEEEKPAEKPASQGSGPPAGKSEPESSHIGRRKTLMIA